MSQAEEDAASETASESSVSTNFDEETDSYTHRDPSSRSTGTSGAGLTSNFPKKKARTSNPRRGFHIGNEHVQAKGKVSRTDGRLSLAVNEGANKGYVAKLLGAGLHRHLGTLGRAGKQHDQAQETLEIEHSLSQQLSKLDTKPPPALNIVIMVIGSRGDSMRHHLDFCVRVEQENTN